MPTCSGALAQQRAVSQRLAPVSHEAAQPPSRAVRPLLFERGPTGEITLVPTDHPAQTGLERGDAGAELVAVEREPRLETKGVTRTQSRRDDALGQHGLPEVGRHLRRDGALHALLPRVARAGHQARGAGPLEALDGEAMDRGGLR